MDNLSKHILVAEDNPVMAQLLAFSLERAGFAVTCAYDGATAAEAARQESFDLVITNIVMPEMDGNELLIYLKNNNLDIKVIAMSDRGLKRSKIYFDVAKALGAQSCLHKPFTEDQLLNEIEGVFQADLMVC